MDQTPTGTGKTLAQKMEFLFKTVTHPEGRPYKSYEVNAALQKRGLKISTSYVQLLRAGTRDNPTKKHLEALAAFFGVPPAYFFDDSTVVEQELEVLLALRMAGVRRIALRAADLPPDGQLLLEQLLDTIGKMTGTARQNDQEPTDPAP